MVMNNVWLRNIAISWRQQTERYTWSDNRLFYCRGFDVWVNRFTPADFAALFWENASAYTVLCSHNTAAVILIMYILLIYIYSVIGRMAFMFDYRRGQNMFYTSTVALLSGSHIRVVRSVYNTPRVYVLQKRLLIRRINWLQWNVKIMVTSGIVRTLQMFANLIPGLQSNSSAYITGSLVAYKRS